MAGVYERFREHFPELEWSTDEMGAVIGPYFYQLRDSRDVRFPVPYNWCTGLRKTILSLWFPVLIGGC
jgi:hypothetical protein